MLRIDLRPGEGVRVGDNVIVRLEQKSGNRARISVEADRSIAIEKLDESQRDTKHAAAFGITGQMKE